MIFRALRPALHLVLGTSLALSSVTLVPALHAQDVKDPKENRSRGRKYKPPPETAHIEVLVTKGYNKKPISNAAVIFHEIDPSGHDDGNLEVKTNPEGKAIIDVIPIGTNLRVQVLASGFATFAEDFMITESSRQIPIEMLRPREQISAYQDNGGKASGLKPGVQEPIRPKAADTSSKSVKVPPSSAPPKAPPLPPEDQNRTSPVSNPAPVDHPNE